MEIFVMGTAQILDSSLPPDGAAGFQEPVPWVPLVLPGQTLVHGFPNQSGDGKAPVAGSFLEKPVLVRAELNLGANHRDTIVALKLMV
jgi:hypothetical protein